MRLWNRVAPGLWVCHLEDGVELRRLGAGDVWAEARFEGGELTKLSFLRRKRAEALTRREERATVVELLEAIGRELPPAQEGAAARVS